MMIWVLDGIDVVGAVTVYNSIIWHVQFNGLDDFELVVPCDDKVRELLIAGRFLCRDTDRNGNHFENIMVIRHIEISYDADSGYFLKLSGTGLKGILSQRIVWNQFNALTARAEIVIREIVQQNVPTGDRDFPPFMLADSHGYTETLTLQAAHENLADWVIETCGEVGFGWRMYIDEGLIRFDLLKGVDRSWSQTDVPPVVFSEDLGNLISCDMVVDYSMFSNVALIGGEGEGTAQKTASVGNAREFERFELYVDGSTVSSNDGAITEEDYAEMLKQLGRAELATHKVSRTFEADIDTERPYRIGEDYEIGDTVEVRGRFGMAATAVLSGILFYEDENGTKTEADFEEWEVQ